MTMTINQHDRHDQQNGSERDEAEPRAGLGRLAVTVTDRLSPTMVVLAFLAGSLLLFTIGDAGSTTVTTLFAVMAVAVVAYVALFVLAMIAGPDREARIIADRLGSDAASRELLHRWLARIRWFRNIGGLCGLIIWFALILNSPDGFDLSLIFVCGMGGVLVGGIVAELHRMTGRSGPRTASLQIRTVDQYLMARDRRRFVTLAAIWIALLALGLLTADARPIVGYALAAIAVLAGTRWLQWRVASRARPQLPASLKRADDLARELAITRSLARPANIVVLGLLIPGLGSLVPWLEADAVAAVGMLAWFLAYWWWLQNHDLGLGWLAGRRSSRGPLPAA